MKFIKTILLASALLFANVMYAQNKKIDKVRTLYQSSKYEKCIEKSDSYIKQDKTLKELLVFKGLSYFEMYKANKKTVLLNKALSNINNAGQKLELYKTQYAKPLAEIHSACRQNADKLYNQNKKNIAVKYYKYLAQIYHDTTSQYMQLVAYKDRPDKELLPKIQNGQINRIDEQGRKQGLWQKVYPSGTIAYEVTFKDDKPQGKMIRRHPNGNLMAEVIFDENKNYASAKLYNDNNEVIATGYYKDKIKEGLWQYFNKKILVKTENYSNGKLNGSVKTFYPNGKLYDIKHFTNNIENGYWEKFYENGTLMLKINIINSKLEGAFKRYYNNGNVEISGQYKNNKKDGTWKYYDADKKINTVKYKDGVAENDDATTKKDFKQYESEIQNRLKDPENFKNNPNEYFGN